MARLLLLFLLFISSAAPSCKAAAAQSLARAEMAEHIRPPYALGEAVNDKGVWQLLNSGGAPAGYVFETRLLAPLLGFSGDPMNFLVMLDGEGRFIEVSIISQHEPVFVSGLGEAPFNAFLEQYRGLSINSPIHVNRQKTGAGEQVLDGVAKATASIRIAHESIMAATLEVAREKLEGVVTAPPARPDPDHRENLDWNALVEQQIAQHITVTNGDLESAFKGSLWEGDDPEALGDPAALYLDLWMIDLGPPSVAEAVLAPETLNEVRKLLEIAPDLEPILVIERARHGLVGPDFVRNTVPDLLELHQNGLPIEIRDADILAELQPGVPDGKSMILRVDRRLGFDPAAPWKLLIHADRKHGMLAPETGRKSFELNVTPSGRFYLREAADDAAGTKPAWLEAIQGRLADIIGLLMFLTALSSRLFGWQEALARHRHFAAIRLAILMVTLVFIGWWGQGQLSIVTLLGLLRSLKEGGGVGFLLYDPYSLAIWCFAFAGFLLWGRSYFCGWLCPYGALQDFTSAIGRTLKLPKFELSAVWDARMKWIKYGALVLLGAAVFLDPERVETYAEIEPFKTAITTGFQREFVYVAYASLWLLLGLFTHKPYCRYLCPLGAAMALGGSMRTRNWIARRKECGSPCQLCRVRCPYGAIAKNGAITYRECFHCLDCVRIHEDKQLCVPLVLANRKAKTERFA